MGFQVSVLIFLLPCSISHLGSTGLRAQSECIVPKHPWGLCRRELRHGRSSSSAVLAALLLASAL